MFDLHSVPAHSDAVIYRVVQGEAIILNLDNSYYYSLDPIGSEIWAMCDGTHPVQSILDRVCAGYNVARDEARRDLLELIDDLQREGLLTIERMADETGPVAS